MNTIMNLQGMKPGKVLEFAEWFTTFKGPLCFLFQGSRSQASHPRKPESSETLFENFKSCTSLSHLISCVVCVGRDKVCLIKNNNSSSNKQS